MKKVITSISQSFKFKAEIRQIDWICEIDENIPATYNTDPKRLKQILINLIGNSMKFTFEGYVKIQAELIQIENEDAIKFSIIDTGTGIKKEDQESLFTLFGTLDTTKQINQTGTGIGLY